MRIINNSDVKKNICCTREQGVYPGKQDLVDLFYLHIVKFYRRRAAENLNSNL